MLFYLNKIMFLLFYNNRIVFPSSKMTMEINLTELQLCYKRLECYFQFQIAAKILGVSNMTGSIEEGKMPILLSAKAIFLMCVPAMFPMHIYRDVNRSE